MAGRARPRPEGEPGIWSGDAARGTPAPGGVPDEGLPGGAGVRGGALTPGEGGASGQPSTRGHAYYASLARRALGVSVEPRLSGVPYPIVHAALGVAACAVAVAIRPGAVGLRGAVIGVGVLCAAAGLLLTVYDRTVYPPALRPPVEEVVLPVAALGAFSLVIAGTLDLTTRLVAAAVTVAVWGGLGHVGELRAAGRMGWVPRFLRDATAITVLVPVLLASVSGALPLPVRAGVALVGVTLVTFDGLRSEEMTAVPAAALALLAGVLVSAALAGVVGVAVQPGPAAAATLVVWYGLRGVEANAIVAPRHLRSAAEHLFVVAVALAGLYWVTR